MTGKTILAVDSDAETTQQIVLVLEAEDYLVFTAPNKDVGLAMAKKVNPSLIFINPALSGASGLEVCKLIHGTEELKDIPIVVLTSFEGAMDPRYAETYGIVDSLKKPFTSEELILKTGSVLSLEYGGIQTNTREEFPAYEAEEAAGFGGGEKTIVMEQQTQTQDWQVGYDKEFDAPEKTVMETRKEMPEPFENTVVEDIPYTEPDEVPKGETERSYKFKTSIRRRGMRSRLFVPLIVALIIIVIIGAGVGFILYKESLLPWLKPSAATPLKPAAKETAAVAAKEQEKPAGETAESKPPAGAPAASVAPSKPAEKPSAVKTAPVAKAPAPKTETKPAGKGLYHVQLGAFKNSANADALAKQLQGKGYDAFVQKGTKDKEAIHRVLIGKYENVKEASKMAKDISAKEKIKTAVFKD